MTPADSHQSVSQGIQGFQALTDHMGHTSGGAAGVNRPADDGDGPLRNLLASNPEPAEYVRGLFSLSRVLLAAPMALNWESSASYILPFARWMKTYRGLIEFDAPAAWELVAGAVAAWQKTADHWWMQFFFMTEEDAQVEFLWWWDRMRSTPTADPLEYALQQADAKPLKLLKATARLRSKKYPRFVSVCGYLQSVLGPRTPIALPLDRIGALLDVEAMTISRYRSWAKADKYLVQMKAHVHRPTGGGRAAEYLFDMSLFPKAFHNSTSEE